MMRIAIVGAGVMGRQIAVLFAKQGHPVSLWNRPGRDLTKEIKRLVQIESRMGRLDREQVDKTIASIEIQSEIDRLREADLFIESVSESLELKLQVLADLSSVASPTAIIATNTSTLSIDTLAQQADAARFLGLHFFNPPSALKLVEIIVGTKTAGATIDLVTGLITAMGHVPMVMPDSPGFTVNRIVFPMINEAIFVLAQGRLDAKSIDQCMRLGMSHPMGPLELADFIGLDVCLSILNTLKEQTGDEKYAPCSLLKDLVTAGKLGRKSGEGFHPYKSRDR